MIIHGREVGFRNTVGATINLAKLCPDGKLENLKDILSGENTAVTMERLAQFIVVLNKADEDAKGYEDAAYVKKPLTVEEVMTLGMKEFRDVQAAALEAFLDGRKTTVELKEAKKNDPESNPAQ